MARRDRETARERQSRRDTSAGIKGMGYVTGSIDTRDVERLMNRLIAFDKKEGMKAVKHACRTALVVVDKEAVDEALKLKLSSRMTKKGWRKTLQSRTAFSYKLRRVKSKSFWFYSAVNYKKPILRVSHLVEKGFKHLNAGFIPGNWFRKSAFRKKKAKAMKVLELNLLYGIDMIRRGKKVPNITQWQKGAPRG